MGGDDKLTSVRAVAAYLNDQGFDVSKSTIANHIKAGKLKRIKKSGPFNIEAVQKYAKKFLVEKPDESNDIKLKWAEDEANAKVQRIQMHADLLKLKRDEKAGSLVDKDYYDMMIGSQTYALIGLLNNFAQTKAITIIEMVKGDNALEEILKRFLMAEFKEYLKNFSRDCNWKVLVEHGLIKVKEQDASL